MKYINSIHQQFLEYRQLHFSVIPVAKNEHPLVTWSEYQWRLPTNEEIEYWSIKYPQANLALVTGEVSQIMVVDVDPRHGGSEKPFIDSITPYVLTGGGGWHFYYSPNQHGYNSFRSKGIEVQGNGRCVILPPSIHASGRRYEWGRKFDRTQLCQLPLIKPELNPLQTVKAYKNKPSITSSNFFTHYTNEQIALAQQIPISSILHGQLITKSNGLWLRCPSGAHADIHPSCRYFPDTNRVYCFTCGFHDRPIGLVQKLFNLNFPQAINYLLNRRD